MLVSIIPLFERARKQADLLNQEEAQGCTPNPEPHAAPDCACLQLVYQVDQSGLS